MDWIEFHWKNYQLRQVHIWQSLNRMIFATAILWSVPFIRPSLFIHLKHFILFFPAVAFLLSLIGRKLILAEYERLKAIMMMLRKLTPDEFRPHFPSKEFEIGAMLKTILRIFIVLAIVDIIVIGLMAFDFILKRPVTD
jgi:hypothetical protein